MELLDLTPDGVIRASMDNWNGKIFVIPGARVYAYDDEALDGAGAYFLMIHGDGGDDTLYVGSAGDVGERVRLRVGDPLGGKTDVPSRTVVAFVGEDLDFETARCLEFRLAGIAASCGRFNVVTEHKSSADIGDSRSAAVDGYIDDAGLVLDALGIYALKPKGRPADPDRA